MGEPWAAGLLWLCERDTRPARDQHRPRLPTHGAVTPLLGVKQRPKNSLPPRLAAVAGGIGRTLILLGGGKRPGCRAEQLLRAPKGKLTHSCICPKLQEMTARLQAADTFAKRRSNAGV